MLPSCFTPDRYPGSGNEAPCISDFSLTTIEEIIERIVERTRSFEHGEVGGVGKLRVLAIANGFGEIRVIVGRRQPVVLATHRKHGYVDFIEPRADIERVTRTEIAARDLPTDIVHRGFRAFEGFLVGGFEQESGFVEELDRTLEVVVEPLQ